MVVTAAVVGGVATAAAAGTAAYSASQTPSTGANPQLRQIPMNPQDAAMKNYFDRLTVANANKNYPAFSSFLASGGDPASAQFPLTMPNLTPNEAASLGFVGGKGEAVPGVSQASVSGVGPQTTTLSKDQMFYMAKERARQAALSGQQPGPWAQSVIQSQQRLNQVGNRLTNLQQQQASGTLGPQQAQRVANQITRTQQRQSNIQQRQSNLLQPGGQLGGPA